MVGYLDTTRSPARDRVMFLVSIKVGLRAKAMTSLAWAMVTAAAGEIGEAIALQNRARKGKTGGRTIPMHPEVSAALVALQTWRGDVAGSDHPPRLLLRPIPLTRHQLSRHILMHQAGDEGLISHPLLRGPNLDRR